MSAGVVKSVTRLGCVGVVALSLVGLVMPAHAQPALYSGAEIRGWVVDAETKQPLDGVHVVAQWILNTGLLEGRRITRLHIVETITDETGVYHLPAWGPKPRPFLSVLEWGSDPILTFFKPGYRPLNRTNYSPPPEDERDMAVRISRWDGRTIDLVPFRGTPQEWADSLSRLQDRLAWGAATDEIIRRVNSNWQYMPRIVLSVVEQRRLLPDRLRPRTRDLEAWQVTEAELRALTGQKGLPQ